MANFTFPLFFGATLALLSVLPARAQLPQRNLVVELREVEESPAYVVSTQPSVPMLAPQQVQVRNGEKATLQMGQSMPIRWVQAVGGESSTRSSSSGSSSSSGGGVNYGMVWMQAGQSLVVKPRWPGGKQSVAVDVDLQSASVDAPTGNAELPSQSRNQVATSVQAPLGQWVTVASTGSNPPAGTYSSEAAVNSLRLIQIRVSVR